MLSYSAIPNELILPKKYDWKNLDRVNILFPVESQTDL